jgi:uncharacterized membrane protein YuzA (DUF378 family)
MIPVKIQCGCGQRYSFDAEPVCGRMPVSITCPVCGADGTTTANEVIAFHLALKMSARNSHKDRVMTCTVIGCLAAGMVGVLKAFKMQGGFDVLLCLMGAVAAFGVVLYIFFGRRL